MSKQAFVPVITWGSTVVGYIPVSPPIEFTGTETEILLQGYSYSIHWLRVNHKNNYDPKSIATIRISPTQERWHDYPPGFYANPGYAYNPFYTERSIVHDKHGGTDWFDWLFVYGETMDPGDADPPVPPDPDGGNEVWILSAEFASNPDCAFVDIDWTAFAPEGTTPLSLELGQEKPGWLATMFARSDMSSNISGFSMAEVAPILRLFRSGSVSPGEYMIPSNVMSLEGGGQYTFDLRLDVT